MTKRGTSTRKALLISFGCLLLTGCGPSHPAATAAPGKSTAAVSSASTPAGTAVRPAGGGVTACDVVTPQDASAALGSSVGAGTPGGTAALSECIYDQGSLIVGMEANSKARYDTAHDTAIAKGAKAVPGVGDSAFDAGTDGYCTLEFLKGNALVSIIVSAPSAEQVAIAVAKAAASKL